MDGKPELPENVEIYVDCGLWVGLARKDIVVGVIVSLNKDEIERVAKLLSEFDLDQTKRAYPVLDENRKVVGCLS